MFSCGLVFDHIDQSVMTTTVFNYFHIWVEKSIAFFYTTIDNIIKIILLVSTLYIAFNLLSSTAV